MVYDFKSGLKATEKARRINSWLGKDTLSEHKAHDWLARYHTKDYHVEEQPRSGCPSGLHDERMHQLVKDDPQQIRRQFSKASEVSQSTVVKYPSTPGFVVKLSKWISHQLTVAQ